ncbi:MAG: G1 family glutamic endopeptidase [Acidimicrobiales bacterium]
MTTPDDTGDRQPPGGRLRRRLGTLVLVVVTGVALVSLILVGVGAVKSATPTNRQAHLGSFAGYVKYVPVTQISADWRVPAILPLSHGGASTWIGVQGAGKGEFFQVGTTENYEAGKTSYEAFWSDPSRDFHAQIMMAVSAGDEIHAQISEVSGRWQAFVYDAATSQVGVAPTASGVFRNLWWAEWIQEDPLLRHGRYSPYPDIAPVTLSHLLVNGAAPSCATLRPQVMVLPHGRRVEPGPLVGDRFVTIEQSANRARSNRASEVYQQAVRRGTATGDDIGGPSRRSISYSLSLRHSRSIFSHASTTRNISLLIVSPAHRPISP